ncbi:MAG: alkaline phosphatase family protein [Gemmatimonadota bacterium]
MTSPARVLFVFLDGVGIGPDDPAVNPFVAAESGLPALEHLSGGRIPTLGQPRTGSSARAAFPLDATLDTEGTPQSGTGQTALLTGESAAQIFGRHFGPWTPVSLRPLVEERSLLRRAREHGRTVSFANAYPKGWPGPGGGRRIAGPPLAARGAGVLDRHEEALADGRAVASEILNDGWRERLGHRSLPRVTAGEAGANLARVSREADLTLFAHYSTDTAGHRQDITAALAALERVDAFFEGLLGHLDSDTLLLVASDHGNIEDVTGGHTRNPAFGAAAGPGADAAPKLTDLRHVARFVLEILGVDETG